jgi:hypothetical protein
MSMPVYANSMIRLTGVGGNLEVDLEIFANAVVCSIERYLNIGLSI